MGYALSRDKMEDFVPRARRRLAKAASERQLVPYGEVMNSLGGRGYVGQVLDELNRREFARGNPLISAIVVKEGANMASDGFFLFRNSETAVMI